MKRLIFAHQLRAVAVISVVISHLVGVFWAMPAVVSSLTNTATPQPQAPPALFRWIVWPHWQPGPFGVALFFLISGLVIPISLANRTAGAFLVGRALRLLPVAICGPLAGLAAVHLLLPAHHQAPWPPPSLVLANLLLVYDWFGLPSLDDVNWSLCVEVKFYVIAALIAPMLRRGRIVVVPAFGAACVLAALAVHAGLVAEPVATMIGEDAVYLSFMAIGALFYLHLWQGLSWPALLGLVLIGTAATCLTWRLSPIASEFPIVTLSYLEALVAFVLLYALRRFARPFAPLDRLADVSYPVYMTHSVLGYALLRCLTGRYGASYDIALVTTIVAILALSTLLHVVAERPGIRLGHRLGRRMFPGRVGTAPMGRRQLIPR